MKKVRICQKRTRRDEGVGCGGCENSRSLSTAFLARTLWERSRVMRVVFGLRIGFSRIDDEASGSHYKIIRCVLLSMFVVVLHRSNLS